MKLTASIVIALALMATACSNSEPKPDVIPPPVDAGPGSEPQPLPVTPPVDEPTRVPE